MEAPIKTRYDKAGPQVAEALRRRHFEAHYVSTAQEALDLALTLIPKDRTVSWGGTVTAAQIGLMDRLHQGDYQLIDRDTGKTPAEKQELMRQALTCGTFIMSSNAISADGQLVNLDGIGDVKARSVYDWCRFTKTDAVKNLMFHILAEELEIEKPEQNTDQSLKGLTFVITGSVHIYKNRDEFKASVEARGGKVAGSVSAKTSYLVENAPEDGSTAKMSTKSKKAHELGIEVLTEDAFVEKFGK